MISVTTGDTLQRPAAYRQLWSGLLSDPVYGDLCVKSVQERKRVGGMCFVAQGNETPESGPVEIMLYILLPELLYNNVNKELHLLELYSSARASRNSQKCYKIFFARSIFAQTVDLLILSLTIYLYASFRYSFRYCTIVLFAFEQCLDKTQRVARVISATTGGTLKRCQVITGWIWVLLRAASTDGINKSIRQTIELCFFSGSS